MRDWSFAGDIVRGAWLMLQQEQPGDYVLASGVPHTVVELAQTAFACVDLEAERYLRVEDSLLRAPESTPALATHARRASSSAGGRSWASRRSCSAWWTPTCARCARRPPAPERAGPVQVKPTLAPG